MSKPRVFIGMHYLEIGGAETSLIGLLNAFDYDKVDVDLFLYSHRGELMRFIPPQVSLLPEIKDYAMIEVPVKEALKNLSLSVAYGRYRAKRAHKIYQERKKPKDGNAIYGYIGKYVTPHLPQISDKTYDLAISFLTPHNIILDKVKAKKKICWIHTDYTKVDVDARLEFPVWSAYDKIISISPSVTDSFCSVFPTLRGKIIEIENILPEKMILTQAGEYIPNEFDRGNFNIVSIGRFTYPKNFDNIPDICSMIIHKSGMKNIRWYIIGYGGDEDLIRRKIHEAGMEEHVILLGKRSNPYPYIKNCDLYIQPSRYEGKSVTVREAQMLGRAVIITDYPTSKSQIDNGSDGIIVPLENSECADVIAAAITDLSILKRISDNTSSRDYSETAEINKIYSLI